MTERWPHEPLSKAVQSTRQYSNLRFKLGDESYVSKGGGRRSPSRGSFHPTHLPKLELFSGYGSPFFPRRVASAHMTKSLALDPHDPSFVEIYCHHAPAFRRVSLRLFGIGISLVYCLIHLLHTVSRVSVKKPAAVQPCKPTSTSICCGAPLPLPAAARRPRHPGMQRPTAEYGGFWQQGQQPARRDMHPPPARTNTFEPRFVPPDVMAGKQAYRPHQQEKIWMQAP
eukprot:COSAG01_NODE_15498_length_1330_cov_35.211210_2_plen_226_part_01